jgi:subtilisin family serine protease
MTPRTVRRTLALVIFGVVALAACVPVKPATPPPPPPPTAPPPPPNPCASVPAQSSANGTDYVAVTNDDGKIGVHKFHAGTTAERDQQLSELGKNAQVVSVAPDQTVHATDITDPLAQPFDPSNPDAPRQWGLFASHFTDAWSTTTGTGVRIAIVDSGVQANHEDLAGQVVAGKDFVTPGVTDGLTDFYGHGTHVAGIAAATINGVGGVGGAPGAKIVSARVLNCSGSGSLFNVEQGVLWASTPVGQGGGGAQVVNLSLGAFSDDPNLDAVIASVEAQGVVVVAAAGNCGSGGFACQNTLNAPLFPAAAGTVHHSDPSQDADVIAVASVDDTGGRSFFSNSNGYVDLTAPGGAIVSACPASLPASKCAPTDGFPGYSFKSGTSMSTPFVSAAAALLTAACPSSVHNLSWVQFVQNRLKSTAQPVQGQPVPDPDYGNGLVRPDNALNGISCPA